MEWKAQFRLVWMFVKYFWRRLGEDACFKNASTLAYTTLLSLVPLFAVFFSIFSSFQAFGSVESRIHDFVFQNFVPASGEVVQTYMQSFAEKAARMTLPGIIGLLVSAFLLMSTIDNALNKIWRTEARRTWRQRLVIYWAVMSLTPLLIGAGFAMWSYVIGLSFAKDMESSVGGLGWLKIAPVLFEWTGFVMLYLIVPNRRIVLRYALAGGFAATLLFEFAKVGFAKFVTSMPSYEAIYGAFATIPIFLIWIYVSWVVILLGAVFTSSLERGDWKDFGQAKSLDLVPYDPEMFVHALWVLRLFFQAHRKGETLTPDVIALQAGEMSSDLTSVLDALERGGWIGAKEEGDWFLRRDVHHATVADVFTSYPYAVPDVPMNRALLLPGLVHQIDVVQEDIRRAMSAPLVSVLESESAT